MLIISYLFLFVLIIYLCVLIRRTYFILKFENMNLFNKDDNIKRYNQMLKDYDIRRAIKSVNERVHR